MQGFDTRRIKGKDLVPISWEQARALMKPKADDNEYYAAALYVLSPAVLLFAAIQMRTMPEGLAAICTVWRGHPVIVAAMRKRDMPQAEYAELVRCLIGIESAGVEDGCVDIWAPPWAMDLCGEMVVDLFGAAGDSEK